MMDAHACEIYALTKNQIYSMNVCVQKGSNYIPEFPYKTKTTQV